jgi:hypothetical protein
MERLQLEIPFSRLTGFGENGVQKETKRVPRWKKENYVPYGRVLDELMGKYGWTQTSLATEIPKYGYRAVHPREAINVAMNRGEQLTYLLVESTVRAMKLTAEDEKRLRDAATDTKEKFGHGKRSQAT